MFVGAMCLMMITSANKTIVIADNTPNGVNSTSSLEVVNPLLLTETEADPRTFWIPLPSGTKAENVVVENAYLDRELRIFIGGADADFYLQSTVMGNVDFLTDAVSKVQKKGVLLCFHTEPVYEFQTSMEQNMLKVVAGKPKDLYDMVVVVDPMPLAADVSAEPIVLGDDVSLTVSRHMAKQWSQERVKLYFTRIDEQTVTDAGRIALVEDTGADIYISLSVVADADRARYGIQTRYNTEYFIPDFGNVELGDILTKSTTIATNNRALGIAEAAPDSVLWQMQIPAAGLELGYVTNPREKELLESDNYRQKLATGVLDGIKEVYTGYYEQSVQ